MSLLKSVLVPVVMIALAVPSLAKADDTTSGSSDQNTDQSSAAPSTGNSASTSAEQKKPAEGTAQETQNNRAKTLEGSQSPFSGQFQLQYNGSTISHPFSAEAPNPRNQPVPPQVDLTGTASARYRIDSATTAGVGFAGIIYTPFNGPKNASIYEPNADIAHSFKFANIHNRVDFQYTQYTSNQMNSQLGYREGLTLLDEAFYEFKFGLSVGLLVELDYNFFSGDPQYDSVAANQTRWDIVTDPYFEFVLNKTFNLRSVIGIENDHNRDMAGTFTLNTPGVYQTLGLGIQPLDWIFLYIFVEPVYSHLTANNTMVGFSTIINLF